MEYISGRGSHGEFVLGIPLPDGCDSSPGIKVCKLDYAERLWSIKSVVQAATKRRLTLALIEKCGIFSIECINPVIFPGRLEHKTVDSLVSGPGLRSVQIIDGPYLVVHFENELRVVEINTEPRRACCIVRIFKLASSEELVVQEGLCSIIFRKSRLSFLHLSLVHSMSNFWLPIDLNSIRGAAGQSSMDQTAWTNQLHDPEHYVTTITVEKSISSSAAIPHVCNQHKPTDIFALEGSKSADFVVYVCGQGNAAVIVKAKSSELLFQRSVCSIDGSIFATDTSISRFLIVDSVDNFGDGFLVVEIDSLRVLYVLSVSNLCVLHKFSNVGIWTAGHCLHPLSPSIIVLPQEQESEKQEFAQQKYCLDGFASGAMLKYSRSSGHDVVIDDGSCQLTLAVTEKLVSYKLQNPLLKEWNNHITAIISAGCDDALSFRNISSGNTLGISSPPKKKRKKKRSLEEAKKKVKRALQHVIGIDTGLKAAIRVQLRKIRSRHATMIKQSEQKMISLRNLRIFFLECMRLPSGNNSLYVSRIFNTLDPSYSEQSLTDDNKKKLNVKEVFAETDCVVVKYAFYYVVESRPMKNLIIFVRLDNLSSNTAILGLQLRVSCLGQKLLSRGGFVSELRSGNSCWLTIAVDFSGECCWNNSNDYASSLYLLNLSAVWTLMPDPLVYSHSKKCGIMKRTVGAMLFFLIIPIPFQLLGSRGSTLSDLKVLHESFNHICRPYILGDFLRAVDIASCLSCSTEHPPIQIAWCTKSVWLQFILDDCGTSDILEEAIRQVVFSSHLRGDSCGVYENFKSFFSNPIRIGGSMLLPKAVEDGCLRRFSGVFHGSSLCGCMHAVHCLLECLRQEWGPTVVISRNFNFSYREEKSVDKIHPFNKCVKMMIESCSAALVQALEQELHLFAELRVVHSRTSQTYYFKGHSGLGSTIYECSNSAKVMSVLQHVEAQLIADNALSSLVIAIESIIL